MSPSRSTWLALPLFALLGGCISNEAAWRKYLSGERGPSNFSLEGTWRFHEGTGERLTIDAATLAPAEPFEAHTESASVSVLGESDQRERPNALAPLIGHAWARMCADLGYEPGLRARFVVVAVEELPSAVDLSFPVEGHRLHFPIFWREGADVADVLRDNQLVIAIGVHELVEISIVEPQHPPTALPDLDYSWGPFKRHAVAHTRWLRDGLAQYAAYCFLCGLDEVVDPPLPHWAHGWLASIDTLAEVGPALFDWSQFDEDLSETHYPAAGGLFLLLAEERGPDALPELVKLASELEVPEGQALERVLGEVVGRDAREWVASLPMLTGVRFLHSDEWSENIRVLDGSPAARAGLATGDRLLSVDGDPNVSIPKLELAVLRARSSGSAVTVDAQRDEMRLEVEWPQP